MDGAHRKCCGREVTPICPDNEAFRDSSIVPGRQAMLGRTIVALNDTGFMFGLAAVAFMLSALCCFAPLRLDAEF